LAKKISITFAVFAWQHPLIFYGTPRFSRNWLGGRESLPRLFENLRNTPNLAERVSVQQFAALNRLRRLSSVRRRFRISPVQ
jgi:hypothetical protein